MGMFDLEATTLVRRDQRRFRATRCVVRRTKKEERNIYCKGKEKKRKTNSGKKKGGIRRNPENIGAFKMIF